MATLMPAFGVCKSRMTPGEKRLAERLEEKLDSDYLLWYDVPVGPKRAHPDFVVMHPRRGLLVLEVKDWRVNAIQHAEQNVWDIITHGTATSVINPLVQARQYAHQVVDALKRDSQLVRPDGKHQGQLAFPWSYGVVLTHITRKQFDEAELSLVIKARRVICQDEIGLRVKPLDLQSRLWDMFPCMMRGVMSPAQLDRVRWLLFPDVRVPIQSRLFDSSDLDAKLPGSMCVMDLQQEQLARSLGDGHRVIHGVAGSGKTLILCHRAEHLAKTQTPTSKPILILCYSEPLAVKLASVMHAKGLANRVHARHFHRWCYQQLVDFGQTLPAHTMPVCAKMADMVQRVIQGVASQQIPGGQYQAILIDEGHDFAPAWLRLVTQMVDPATASLLMLCDDAQNIYERSRSRQFSFKSVGIQAQGRTTNLKINYRNTKQILHTASLMATDLLTAQDRDDDGIPQLKPISCGRDGEAPLIIRLPNFHAEAAKMADLLNAAHQEGYAWGDMAVICRHYDEMDECALALNRRQLPHQMRQRPGDFSPLADTIKVLTMHASKGLEFAVVALMGVGQMPTPGEDEQDEARLFYVAATRATQRLLITTSGDGEFGSRLGPHPCAAPKARAYD
jgi:hypothetical protein